MRCGMRPASCHQGKSPEPEASEAAWADRAARRKGRIDFRLAFIASKFRLAVTLLEMQASAEVWRRYVGVFTETLQ